MKKQLYALWLRLLIVFAYIFRIFPIDRRKILFSSFSGKGFGDNAKYIAIKIHEMDPNIRMYWIVKDLGEKMPEWIHPVRINSIFSVFVYTTAKVWVDNSRKSIHIRKRRGQFYIQTWHGGLGIKRVEKDTVTPLPDGWIKASKHDSKLIDYMISNSVFCTEMYKRAFWYDGKILECGSPRNDILFLDDNNLIISIKKKLNIYKDAFVILYAPTFRADKKDIYDIKPDEVSQLYGKRENKETIFLVRMHPLVSASECAICQRKDVIDVSNYPDMNELMLISNVLITDYSSSMFEMSLTGKEVQLYAKDLSVFSEERGSYYELSDIPFPIGISEEELYQNIVSFDIHRYQLDLEQFFKKVGCCENGKASETVSSLIFDLLNN